MFESYSNVRICIRMLKECVFSTCSWKMAYSDDVGKKISQLHQELVNACKKKIRFRFWLGRWGFIWIRKSWRIRKSLHKCERSIRYLPVKQLLGLIKNIKIDLFFLMIWIIIWSELLRNLTINNKIPIISINF